MTLNKLIEEYRESMKLDFSLNFLINKTDKNDLDKIARKREITTSGLLRLLIKDFIKDQKKSGVI